MIVRQSTPSKSIKNSPKSIKNPSKIHQKSINNHQNPPKSIKNNPTSINQSRYSKVHHNPSRSSKIHKSQSTIHHNPATSTKIDQNLPKSITIQQTPWNDPSTSRNQQQHQNFNIIQSVNPSVNPSQFPAGHPSHPFSVRRRCWNALKLWLARFFQRLSHQDPWVFQRFFRFTFSLQPIWSHPKSSFFFWDERKGFTLKGEQTYMNVPSRILP